MKILNSIAVALSVLLVLAGCGGGNPYGPKGAGNATTSFAIAPISPASVTWGQSTNIPIIVTQVSRTNRAPRTVSLSATGMPAGVTATFGTNPVTPTSQGATSVLTLSTAIDIAPPTGPFTITISGSDGVETRSKTFTVSVVTSPTTFDIGQINARTMRLGETLSVPIVVTRVLAARANSDVNLSVTGLPPGATGTITPNPVTPTDPGATATLAITTDAEMTSSVGIYTLTITGTDGQDTRSVQMSLTVNPGLAWTILPVDSQTVTLGQRADFQVTIQELNALEGDPSIPVNLTVTGLPLGATAQFDPNPVSALPAGGVATLHVFTTGAAVRGVSNIGTFVLTINASDGTRTNGVTTLLTVLAP